MAKKPKKIERLEDLTPDPINANRGTARGHALIDAALETVGAGRSIVVDRNGIVLAGNQTHEKAVAKGFGLKLVATHGQELIVHQRLDLDAVEEPERARKLALLDNRASEVGLSWDPEILRTYQQEGWAGVAFFEGELDRLCAALPTGPIDPGGGAPISTDMPMSAPVSPGTLAEDTRNPPERRPEGEPIIQYNIVFDDEDQQTRFYALIRMLKTRYPDEPTIGARFDRWLRETCEGL